MRRLPALHVNHVIVVPPVAISGSVRRERCVKLWSAPGVPPVAISGSVRRNEYFARHPEMVLVPPVAISGSVRRLPRWEAGTVPNHRSPRRDFRKREAARNPTKGNDPLPVPPVAISGSVRRTAAFSVCEACNRGSPRRDFRKREAASNFGNSAARCRSSPRRDFRKREAVYEAGWIKQIRKFPPSRFQEA